LPSWSAFYDRLQQFLLANALCAIFTLGLYAGGRFAGALREIHELHHRIFNAQPTEKRHASDHLQLQDSKPIYRDKREPGTGGGTGMAVFCGMMLIALAAMICSPFFFSVK
jgi:hypothetical protein